MTRVILSGNGFLRIQRSALGSHECRATEVSQTAGVSEAVRCLPLVLRIRLDEFLDSLHNLTWLIDDFAHRDFQLVAAQNLEV